MVVDQLTEKATDSLFRALSDATRRDIMRRSAQGGSSVTALAEAYPMSFAAVQKHVAVLERAGLVIKERRGREQIVRAELEAIQAAQRSLDGLEAIWRDRIERMSGVLSDDNSSDN